MNEISIPRRLARLLVLITAALCAPLAAQELPPADILFSNVRVFDGASETLSEPTDVLVRGTLFMASLTLAMGRTMVLPGGIHLVIFAAFLILAALP
ncbi:hypothetical protein [Erythrobacter sp.]|uniref:hypothetical protein n=1 Tax=Erythrobacter sp. TaxID=1042 RepID=UPI001425BC67|nr:hypothetical protein [Erythrobacter sp.]QIQ85236.1 MAG: hypothetical protein G9473_06440 [Erythrobacter sp.]